MPWQPPKELRKCPYHPDEDMVWVRKRVGKTRRSKLWWFERCEECEWNPPKVSTSGDGLTCPHIPSLGERLDAEDERKRKANRKKANRSDRS